MLTVQTKNHENVPVALQVQTPYGAKSVEVQPGKTQSQAFSSRLAVLPPDSASATGTATIDGQRVTSLTEAAYSSISCG